VIPSSEVSRRHAEIVAGDAGYVVTDNSTNGLFVNGQRVEGMQILGRADILRIGPEEFRFYADVAAVSAVAVAPAGDGVPAAVPAKAPDKPMPAPAPEASVPAPDREPAAASETDRPQGQPKGALAILEVVSSGILRGQQYPVKSILAHLGRGEHNDVIIAEESVSDSHAKLQRRDGVWSIPDVGSTNGTYVAGRRITAEERLGHTADIRVGGVKLTFSTVATEPVTGPRGATREFSGAASADGARGGAAARIAPAERASAGGPVRSPYQPVRREVPSAAPTGRAGGGAGVRWLWVVLAAVAAAAATFYVMKGR
jgi:pSer/pThr/pTyr-binding forkhead associated (FHA) protein